MLNFFTKSLIKRQLKGVPDAEIEKLFLLIEKNPDFFKKMAEEVQKKVKSGLSQEDAAKQFAEEHKDEMRGILGK